MSNQDNRFGLSDEEYSQVKKAVDNFNAMGLYCTAENLVATFGSPPGVGVEWVTVTIQIGNTDNNLSQKRWAQYVNYVRALVEIWAFETHFFGGSAAWHEWQNMCWVITVSDDNLKVLQEKLSDAKEYYCQDSIAWSESVTELI